MQSEYAMGVEPARGLSTRGVSTRKIAWGTVMSVVHVPEVWGKEVCCAALYSPQKLCVRNLLAGCARPCVLHRCLPSLVQPTLLAHQPQKAAE